MDLKKNIQELKGFEVDSQKIVFKGKATANTDELAKLGVKEGDFLVILMLMKVRFNLTQKSEPKKIQEKPAL